MHGYVGNELTAARFLLGYRHSSQGEAMRLALFFTILLIVANEFPQATQAASPLIEIVTEQGTYRGRNAAHDAHVCWLMEQDGRLVRVELSQVRSFREVSSRFVPCSSSELRTALVKEFGRGYEIKGSTHYLVCAAEGHAQSYADRMERLYREMYVYLSTRDFSVSKPEFPLVAIVFSSQQEFADYARRDGITRIAGLGGYYEPRTNRVALFDPATASHTASRETSSAGQVLARAGELSENLERTLIHEATHQVAFNLGLHSRIGPTPRWVVEGLAMVFEHPEARSAVKTGSARQRRNHERYVWFGNYTQSRRGSGGLSRLLQDDQLFQAATLDAYSEAWALSFFLMETRGAAHARYLALIASRKPLEEYSVEERLADFRAIFGEDLDRLEVEFLRYMQRL